MSASRSGTRPRKCFANHCAASVFRRRSFCAPLPSRGPVDGTVIESCMLGRLCWSRQSEKLPEEAFSHGHNKRAYHSILMRMARGWASIWSATGPCEFVGARYFGHSETRRKQVLFGDSATATTERAVRPWRTAFQCSCRGKHRAMQLVSGHPI